MKSIAYALSAAIAAVTTGVTVVGENMGNKQPNRGLTLATATTLTGVPGTDVSIGDNRASVVGEKLRVGVPGCIISVW